VQDRELVEDLRQQVSSSPEEICRAYEEYRAAVSSEQLPHRLRRGGRHGTSRATGVFYTPPAVAELMVSLLLAHHPRAPAELTLLDPACGAGAFLLAAVRQGVGAVRGLDRDATALAVAELALDRLPSPPGALRLEPGDVLAQPLPDDVDAIVANPPYVSSDTLAPDQRDLLRASFRDWIKPSSKPDLYIYFLARIAEVLLRRAAVACVIVPNRVLSGDVTAPLRARLRPLLHEVLDLSELRVFPAADVHPVILLLASTPGQDSRTYRVCTPPGIGKALSAPRQELPRNLGSPWGEVWITRAAPEVVPLLQHVAQFPPLGEVARVSEGLRGPTLDQATVDALPVEARRDLVPEFRGRHVRPYRVCGHAGHLAIPPGVRPGSRLALQRGRKAVFPELAPRLYGAVQAGWVAYGGVYFVAEDRCTRPLEVLVAVACSPLATVLYRTLFGAGAWGGSLKFRSTYLERLPLPPDPRHDQQLVQLVRYLGRTPDDRTAIRAVHRLVDDLFELSPDLEAVVEAGLPAVEHAPLPGLREALATAARVSDPGSRPGSPRRSSGSPSAGSCGTSPCPPSASWA
jgi:hypothetical protein